MRCLGRKQSTAKIRFLHNSDLTISLIVRTEFVFFCSYHDKSEMLNYSGSMAEGRIVERDGEDTGDRKTNKRDDEFLDISNVIFLWRRPSIYTFDCS